MAAPISAEAISQMQADIDADLPQFRVASRAGLSIQSIQRLINLGKLTVSEKQNRNGFTLGSNANGIYPWWLPRDLRADYLDNLRLYGEEHAARLARAAKAEAMMMEA